MFSIRSIPLRERFLLLMLPVVVGAPVVVGLLGHRLLESRFTEEVESNLSSKLLSQVLPLTGRLETLRHELRLVALSPSPDSSRALPPDELSAAWHTKALMLLARSPELEEVFFVRAADGVTHLNRCTRNGLQHETYPTSDGPPWLQTDGEDARRARENYALSHRPRETPGPDGPVLWAIDAVESTPGLFVGAVLPTSVFAPYLEPLDESRGAYTILVANDGAVLHPAGLGYEPMKSIFSSSAACASHVGDGLLASEEPVSFCPHSSNQLIIAAHRNPGLGLVAGYVVPRSVLGADLALFSRAIWGIVALTAILAVVVISLLVGWIGQPLTRLSRAMEEVSTGRLDRRIEVRGGDEVARLATSFNTMISDLQATQVALKTQSRQLADALREVESVDSMKDSFLALVSHEVRTPLTSIMGGIEYLKDGPFPNREDTETEFMQIIYESSQRLAGFMNDAILMASLQSSHNRGGFAEFSLTALMQQTAQESEELRARQMLHLHNRLGDADEVFVNGDWTLLQVALQKILANALWHNRPDGRVDIDLVDHIREDGTNLHNLMHAGGEVELGSGWDWLALRVFNTGPIIPEAKLGSLFERFELTHNIENHQRGSGLSLPIAMYIMERHHGTIVVRTVDGKGMAFYLILPARQGTQKRPLDHLQIDGVDETVAAAHLLEAVEEEIEAAQNVERAFHARAVNPSPAEPEPTTEVDPDPVRS